SATGSFEFLDSDIESLHQYFLSHDSNEAVLESVKLFDCYDVCKESIEILTMLSMLCPGQLQSVIRDDKSQNFFIDLLLVCKESTIRTTMMEQFSLIITKCGQNGDILSSCIDLLFKHLQTFVAKFNQKSSQFFLLLCNLLNYAFHN